MIGGTNTLKAERYSEVCHRLKAENKSAIVEATSEMLMVTLSGSQAGHQRLRL